MLPFAVEFVQQTASLMATFMHRVDSFGRAGADQRRPGVLTAISGHSHGGGEQVRRFPDRDIPSFWQPPGTLLLPSANIRLPHLPSRGKPMGGADVRTKGV